MKMNHTVTRETKNDVKQAIRSKYAWPGGHPLYIITNDGAALCVDCAKKEFRQIAWDWTRKQDTGWCAVAAAINWEDTDTSCDHCGNAIEVAYGDGVNL